MMHVLTDMVTANTFAEQALVTEYAAIKQHGLHVQALLLPQLANEALLLAGLYPEQSFRRAVDPTYFQYMGVRMYSEVSALYVRRDTHQSQLYDDLATHFSHLIQMLFYMRCMQQGVPVAVMHQLSGHCCHAYDAVYDQL